MVRRKKPLRSKSAHTLFQISGRGDTDIAPLTKDDVPLVCTDLVPYDSPCPKDASMDETRVVLDTHEDDLPDEQLKLAANEKKRKRAVTQESKAKKKSVDNPKDKEAPSVRKVDKAWEHATNVEENGKKVFMCNFCRKIIRGGGINRVKQHLAGRKGEVAPCKLVDPDVRFAIEATLKLPEPDASLRRSGRLVSLEKVKEKISNVISDNDDDEEQDDVNLVNNKDKGDTDIGHITRDDVSLVSTDILPNDSPCQEDVSMDETRVLLDTQEDGLLDEQLKLAEPDGNILGETTVLCQNVDTEEGEISRDFMDFTPEDSIGIKSRVESDNNLSLLSRVAVENVGKDLTGIVVHGNSREPAKQATVVIGSDSSPRRSGRLRLLENNLNNSETRNQDLINPLKSQGSSTQKVIVYKRAKNPVNINPVGEHHEDASLKVVNASVNKRVDNPKDREAPSVQELDKAWEYVTQPVEENGKKVLVCNFCRKIIRGGGINRVKKHLAGQKGEVAACTLVDPDVRSAIEASLKEFRKKVLQRTSLEKLSPKRSQKPFKSYL